jgi:NADH-quinone oxidoreductase subunit M
MLELPILSITILLPLIGATFIGFFVSQSTSPHKQLYAMYVALLVSILTLISTAWLLMSFNYQASGYQFIERYEWTKAIGLEYYVGVDGFSIFLIFLSALLSLICIIASLFTIQKYIKEFLICLLLIEAFCIGAFSALNLLLFYLFFEIILIPLYLIIGVWGGENRIYAALKFFIYTFFGSVFFLLSLIYIYTKTASFDMLVLGELLPKLDIEIQQILWLGTFIAFAVKIPTLPFHTWLPDAHVQAPTAGSIILAGILLKLGSYALLRISLPFFPLASEYFAQGVIYLSAAAVIYGSLVALAQTDMKKMIAYSSVAHMGFVTAGVFSFTTKGITGAVFQMISHGLISSALFLIVGILYERNHTKQIDQYGAIANSMPNLAIFFMISMLGSIGLPGTSGFIGEILSIIGIFKVNIVGGAIVAFGVVLGALYMLKLYRAVMLGPVINKNTSDFVDLYSYEKLALLPLIILIIYLGLAPNIIIKATDAPTQNLLNIYQKQ